MSSISLYMATVMFAGDWLDATNEKSKQLIPFGERDPFADWQREARHLRRPKGKKFKLKPHTHTFVVPIPCAGTGDALLACLELRIISVSFSYMPHSLSLANLIRTEKSTAKVWSRDKSTCCKHSQEACISYRRAS
jgi:hypothetical protein